MKTKMFLLLVAALFVLSQCAADIEPDEPEFCSLCVSVPCHAPCILNMSTGSIAELTVYDPHPIKVAELAEVQSDGYLGLSIVDGVFMVRDPHVHETSVNMPFCKDRIDKSLFCKSCRKLITSVSEYGYVLLDLYDPAALHAYPVYDGACYEIRCYTVSVTQSEPTGKYAMVVKGNSDDDGA